MEAFEALLHLITNTTHGPALYGVVALAAALDAVLPLVPSGTILISAAVLSARPVGPTIWLVGAVGAFGAIVGDNAMYWLGRTLGERAVRRLAGGPRAAARVRSASSQIQRHGPALVIGARFIPGGRVAVTLAPAPW